MLILEDVKKMLGIPTETKDFDQELLIFINSVVATLIQLGAVDKGAGNVKMESEWSELDVADEMYDVRSYIYLRVRVLFDPPTIGKHSDVINEQIKELEWRLNVNSEEVRR